MPPLAMTRSMRTLPTVLPIQSGMKELYNANSMHCHLKCYENEVSAYLAPGLVKRGWRGANQHLQSELKSVGRRRLEAETTRLFRFPYLTSSAAQRKPAYWM